MRMPSAVFAAAILLAAVAASAQDPAQPRWYGESVAGSGDSAWGLKLGYRLSRGWSLEGGYGGFGNLNYGATTAAPVAEPFIGGFNKPRAWSFAGVGAALPVGRWSALGAGATYEFGARWYGRLGWDRYMRMGDEYGGGRSEVDVYGLGMGWRF